MGQQTQHAPENLINSKLRKWLSETPGTDSLRWRFAVYNRAGGV